MNNIMLPVLLCWFNFSRLVASEFGFFRPKSLEIKIIIPSEESLVILPKFEPVVEDGIIIQKRRKESDDIGENFQAHAAANMLCNDICEQVLEHSIWGWEYVWKPKYKWPKYNRQYGAAFPMGVYGLASDRRIFLEYIRFIRFQSYINFIAVLYNINKELI